MINPLTRYCFDRAQRAVSLSARGRMDRDGVAVLLRTARLWSGAADLAAWTTNSIAAAHLRSLAAELDDVTDHRQLDRAEAYLHLAQTAHRLNIDDVDQATPAPAAA
ncbi:hypothetical protein [Actinoalloteichus sp. GBA129-24]|uniref:hypothetical protein n=1 Tax=Actinoalloteichus sp. GBA129-24 TaxID=1612551 RepID=UPI00095089C2|nr:hypothetical protein [Actinoalloteichus sp. GBA129-24]APU20134.1 hypothetical protein UA75_10605 [Actinoalloteichus sp. GBA129-24]